MLKIREFLKMLLIILQVRVERDLILLQLSKNALILLFLDSLTIITLIALALRVLRGPTGTTKKINLKLIIIKSHRNIIKMSSSKDIIICLHSILTVNSNIFNNVKVLVVIYKEWVLLLKLRKVNRFLALCLAACH